MDPLPQGFPEYWAPEVTYANGVFYLYYSAGNEETMHLRVATSPRPDGPFVDAGRELTHEPFAIDAHVFTDTDGTRYLFYATDFLDRERVGTGTVVDRLVDPLTLEGQPHPVTLAQYDWQIFDPCRAEKGNLRWHTLEGPFVLKHKGRYYQMFSGGNYQNESYGVGYGVTEDIKERAEWQQGIDGQRRLPILHSIPGAVAGPGHNSVTPGPDHRQLFCVYHEIKPDQGLFARVLAVDRLEWIGNRLAVLGPSFTPQPSPIQARAWINQPLTLNGTWGTALEGPSFLFQTWSQSVGAATRLGVGLEGAAGRLLDAALDPQRSQVTISVMAGDGAVVNLPPDFNPQAPHCYEVEVNGSQVALRIDDASLAWAGSLAGRPERLSLFTEGGEAIFSTADMTYGYEDSFDRQELDPAALGWSKAGEEDLETIWQIDEGNLRVSVGEAAPLSLVKQVALPEYEWVVNFRLRRGNGLSFYPAMPSGDHGLEVRLEIGETSWQLNVGDRHILLPEEFNPREFQQLRFWKQDGHLQVRSLTGILGEWPVSREPTAAGLGLPAASEVNLDLVRMTALSFQSAA